MNEADSRLSSLNLNNQMLSDSILIKEDSMLLQLSKGQNDILSAIYQSEEIRIIELMSNDLFWALIGGILGIVFSLVVWSGKWVIESFLYKRRYGKYAGYYVSKIANDTTDPHYILKLEQKRNEFEIKGVSVMRKNGNLEKRHENITGHITMGNTSKIFGVGQYQHDPEEGDKIRSGEYRIQLAPERKIIAIQNIIDNNLHQSIPKFIWEPVDRSQDQEYIDFYNSLIK